MSKRILVIEDEKGIQEFLRACLEQSGYIVNLASDGVEGMKAFQKDLYGYFNAQNGWLCCM